MANNAQFSGIQPLRPPVFVAGPPQGTRPSMPMQFRTEVPAQQSQPYMPVASQQFQPVVQINIGLPPHTQQHQFSQPMQQLPARPVQAGHNLLPSQAIPVADAHPNRPSAFISPQSQQNAQIPNNYMPNLGGPRMPPSLSYSYSVPSCGQLQINSDAMTQYQPISQMNLPPATGQPWLSAGSQSLISVTPVQQTGEQSSVIATVIPTTAQPNLIEKGSSDWKEHVSRDGRRYYYNRKTGSSSWEKPLELMTLLERADASTDWKEFTSPDGRKYYYNKVTKQSKWTIPDELKLARAKMASINESQVEKNADSHASVASSFSAVEVPSPEADTSSSPACGVVSSPIPVTPVVAAINPQPVVASESPVSSVTQSTLTTNAVEVQTSDQNVTPIASVAGSAEISITSEDALTTSKSTLSDQDTVITANGISAGDIEEAKKDTVIAGEVNVSAPGEKIIDKQPVVYESKLEAKNAFKALLESANIGSDWSWDQAMRVIINDKRYSALRSLGERKQAFNEFLGEKKKQDVEERRAKQKKAREDFKKMLEESKELTSSTRWSKAIALFEDDERFRAVERAKDREHFFEKFMGELVEKARARALEEHKRNRTEYLKFLKSCDFITASSQWRKVQDRLEADESCSRLEKIDRLEIFQEYVRDLEKEEEEQRKMRMEESRKAERKNRDEFRKLMELHVAEGTLTAETHCRDYCMKVKDLPAYVAVSSNTSGSTAKDLFEDVAEELQKQYTEDKARIKDALKLRKISLSSTWTLEDFKAAISEEISSPPISDINLKLAFNELQERVREKEEKEAKKRKRAGDDFYDLLCTSKEINASSKWEDHKPLFEDRLENWFIAEESYFREIFEKYITELKEKAKEKERKRWEEKTKKDKEGNDREKRKTKHRREKERVESKTGKGRSMKDGTESDDADRTETDVLEGNRRSGKDRDKKHRKRHVSSVDDLSFDEDEKDGSKTSHRHGSDRKKYKQMDRHGGTSEPDCESRQRRHKRDHRNGSHRTGHYEELQDMELGEDGKFGS
ncbi:pre-mRNA-processing protein 40A-like isoform X2 [Cornus florida]|uniref:pre-mRNA-processing protein 40A-like isoform X2 n=1 Tax=Cornus florida TaxID=4283 RepID=UPI00289D3AEC|nr:pre-mRNA-processing protein 40A-like isoform X2 [Cornus florida]